MNASIFLGIDPGQTGALALYTPASGELEVFDVPMLKIGGKTAVDHYGLARQVDAWAPLNPSVLIEYVSASPQMGVTSAFKFGDTYGLLKGVCAAHFLGISVVTPGQWKRAYGLKADKDASRAKACSFFPKHTALFARKKDDGRAEAALIARYAALQAQLRAA
jgi:crossover junction endodeoxyribonuclease RuvC